MLRNIVVCCDGTGNEYGSNNTNVVKLYEAIVRDADQVAFYDPGVGTFSFLGRTLGRRVGRTLGKAFGAGLQQNIGALIHGSVLARMDDPALGYAPANLPGAHTVVE